MGKTSVFDLDPDRLKRLLGIGKEEADAAQAEPSESTRLADVPTEDVGSWVGRYRLLRILGEGGMGVVYLAEQEHPIKRQVALKIIKPGMDSRRVITRFEAERQTLALLDHPNIAHVHDAGTTQSGRPYFVMEYVEGLPITEHCDRHKLGIEERLRLFAQVCQAVHHAHQRGFIHRDIKPSNILVAVQDGQPVPKVIDFGVARALGQPLTQETLCTQEGQLIGTPEFMSPEQIDLAHEDVDTRSDVYSLGVLLYVLLVGVLPFESEALREGGLEHLRRMVRDQDPKTPSTRLTSLGKKAVEAAAHRQTDVRTLTRRLHGELEWIPLKTMRKEREQRYRSAAELADDIQNYLKGDPLIAGPPSRLYRARKFVRRNRTSVIATMIAGLAITVGAVLSLATTVRARVQTEQARAVRGLLNDTVFRALNPYRPQGGEITALSVLDAVATGVEGQFQNAPLIEADIRHRLGATYEGYSQYDRAVQHLQRALDIRRRELGDHDPLTAESMHRLAWALSNAGRVREAEPLFLEAVAEYVRQYGEDDWRAIAAKRMLSWNYMHLGEYKMALPLCQEVLNTARRVLGKYNSQTTVTATLGMSILSQIEEDYSQEEKWLGEALQLSIRGQGERQALTWEITGWLGRVYMLQGRYAEAEGALTEAISHVGRVFGEGNPRTVPHVKTLVRLYVAWGKLEEAAKWRARLVAATSADPSRVSGRVRYDQRTESYAIQGSGMDIWHILDEFHFAHKTLQGDGSITARIDSIENVSIWTKAGIMVRRTLEPTSEHASVFITPAGTVAFHYRSTQRGARSSRYLSTRAIAFPHWVRLTRRGSAFLAEHSGDGTIWEEVRGHDPNHSGPVEIGMDETVDVGLAVTSCDVSRMAQACISNVVVTGNVSLAGPFTVSEDIGLPMMVSPAEKGSQRTAVDPNAIATPAHSETRPLQFIGGELIASDVEALTLRHGVSAGSIRYEPATDTYTVVGSGKDIGLKEDEFHYAHKKLAGNGSITARIDSVQHVHDWTRAGLMIRNSLRSNSEYVAVHITPMLRVCFEYRSAPGQNAISLHTDPNAMSLPHWIRLVRQGNRFSAQHSGDGRTWRPLEGRDSFTVGSKTRRVSAEVQMNEVTYIGLSVTSHAGPSAPAEARMSNVAVTGNITPPGEFLWSEDIGFKLIALPDK